MKARPPKIHAAFGAAVDRAVLLGSDREQESGVVFELTGTTARRVGTLEAVCRSVAMARDGSAYGTAGATLLQFRGSVPTTVPGPARVTELHAVWCGAGIGGKGEVLVVAEADECILHRRAGARWSRLKLPPEASNLNAIRGDRLDALFFCTGEGILEYDGRATRWVLSNEVDEDDPTFLDDDPSAIVPLDDGAFLIVGDRLHVWTRGKKPRRVESPAKDGHCIGVTKLGADVFIATSSGMVRFAKQRARRENDDGCIRLERLGDGLLATGYEGGATRFDGAKWSKIRFA